MTVCSGNICRSPMAEQILRVQLEPVHGLEVASAGTIGLTGSPMDERAARLAERLGSRDADAHCARALDIEMVRGSNLVFAMAREHRKAVVELLPRAARKTFTIREFARITSFLSKEDIRDILETNDDLTERFDAAIGLVADERGMLPPVAPSEDDVVDPYGRTDDIFVQSAEQLMPAVTASASFIRGIASGAVVFQ
ncbi:protein-tyrosine phosphatase [Paramicrobacterium humi]|uniref:Protein-tyrosine phosphatase n=1 Tax=Paramicrobacterium humi TaxID=640635 RepID=A0A1H4ND89_9MICO|nr:protein-tyrosine phosphatase [Microbacterium humi]